MEVGPPKIPPKCHLPPPDVPKALRWHRGEGSRTPKSGTEELGGSRGDLGELRRGLGVNWDGLGCFGEWGVLRESFGVWVREVRKVCGSNLGSQEAFLRFGLWEQDGPSKMLVCRVAPEKFRGPIWDPTQLLESSLVAQGGARDLLGSNLGS